eukprot:4049782-Pyramimonas_sp.AAC.1
MTIVMTGGADPLTNRSTTGLVRSDRWRGAPAGAAGVAAAAGRRARGSHYSGAPVWGGPEGRAALHRRAVRGDLRVATTTEARRR